MILHLPRERPAPWAIRKPGGKRKWLTPFIAFEWMWDWVAFALSRWSFLEVLEYLGTFSVLIAVIFYFSESGDRVKQRHYQAWQVINTAQGKGGSGGRIEALQELSADKVPLVGVDVSSAFLQGLNLQGANLMRSDFSAADVRSGNFTAVNFTLANLNSANFRGAMLDRANFTQADLRNADLTGSSLAGADLSGATLEDADLRLANVQNVKWQGLKSVKGTNIAGLRNSPAGFAEWALKNGAVDNPDAHE
jgi:Pentapeptide repeats (8 copies)